MYSIKKAICLVLALSCGFTLTACNATYKALSEEYQGQRLPVRVAYSNENSADVVYPTGGSYVSGPLVAVLVIAVAQAAAQAHQAQQAREIAKDIENALNNYNFTANVRNPTYSAIKSAKWLNVKGLDKVDPTKTANQILKDVEENFAVVVSYDYKLMSKENMINYLNFHVYERNEQGSGFQEIYKVRLNESFQISNNGSASDERVGHWHTNGGKLLQKAITQTTRSMLSKLRQYLANPHNKQMQQHIRDEESGVEITNKPQVSAQEAPKKKNFGARS